MKIVLILLAMLIPLVAGIVLPIVKFKNIKSKYIASAITIFVTFIVVVVNAFINREIVTIAKFSSTLSISFKIDELAALFTILFNLIYLCVAIYSIEYMKNEKHERIFNTSFVLSLGALNAVCYSANLVTLYMSFEFVTLLSMPMVLTNMNKDAISATLKYLFYSISGALLGLLGIFFISYIANSSDFVYGGSGLDLKGLDVNFVYAMILIAIFGFGAKSGLFPLHGWLPSAHPIAPAPASALMSSVIAKMGVIVIIRIVYYILGPEFIFGSWMQYVWLSVAVITILMGSYMAMIQEDFKKRLAYSTISQISYAIFGVALCSSLGLEGAIIQIISHALIKTVLFLYAGEVIFVNKTHSVKELKGIGKQMPISTWCYTLASLGLIGIPFTTGFISKWYLSIASLKGLIAVFDYLGPIIMLISAILTAAYLLPITIKGFFVGKDKGLYTYNEASKLMYIPIVFLSVLIIVFGIFINPILNYIEGFVL